MRLSQLQVRSIRRVLFRSISETQLAVLLRAGTNRFFVAQMRLIGARHHRQQVDDADEALPLFRQQVAALLPAAASSCGAFGSGLEGVYDDVLCSVAVVLEDAWGSITSVSARW